MDLGLEGIRTHMTWVQTLFLVFGLTKRVHKFVTLEWSFFFNLKVFIESFDFKVGLGILQITSAKRCPQVWPSFGSSLFSTDFVEFDQAV